MARTLVLIAASTLALAACGRTEEPAANETAVAGNEVVPAAEEEESAVAGAATIRTAQKDPFGAYLVDGEGRSLYILEADTRGAAGTPPASKCADDCTRAWPPLTTSGPPQPGDEVAGERLATFTRADGSMQVTYNGWPLYRYRTDERPGDTRGHDVHDSWGGWYLIAPSGEPIEDAQ